MSYDMNEKEMVEKIIDNYSNLQRIKNAVDIKKEIEYQERLLKAKLESFGIVAERLEIE